MSTLFWLINHICVGCCFVLLSSKKMPERCVVYGCDNTANSKQGISLYRIPYWDDDREIAVRRRKIWLDFIIRWTLLFTKDCFEYGSDTVEKYKTPKLKRDEIGISVVPSLLSKATSVPRERSLRMQHRAKVTIIYYCVLLSLNVYDYPKRL